LALTDGTDGGADYSAINWANPAQVYPVVCAVLESPAYFSSILSGLVLSVGGLSETTAKFSSKALLSYCERAVAAGRSDRVQDLASALVLLLVRNKKCDRVITPTLKSIVLMVSEGVFDTLNAVFLAQWTHSLYSALGTEARGSTNLAKLCVILDLLVRALSLHSGPTRHLGLQTTFSMLTHKYPRVRKRKFHFVAY
jgi:hypothetical protein